MYNRVAGSLTNNQLQSCEILYKSCDRQRVIVLKGFVLAVSYKVERRRIGRMENRCVKHVKGCSCKISYSETQRHVKCVPKCPSGFKITEFIAGHSGLYNNVNSALDLGKINKAQKWAKCT
jgi:hypothetical protein